MRVIPYHRDKFEEYMRSIGNGALLSRYGDGGYIILSIPMDFEVWKAACRELARQARKATVTSKWDGQINPLDFYVDTFTIPGASVWSSLRNTVVRVTHLPTGLYAESSASRSQHRNKAKAMELLKRKLETLTKGGLANG